MAQSIQELIETGQLPQIDQEFLSLLADENGKFTYQESDQWDFKANWPQSYSDEYFHGICRLICAFRNSKGGLIIFGVDDVTRISTRSKIIPNVDRLSQSYSQTVKDTVEFSYKRYLDSEGRHVDVLLVPPRSKQSLPVRFLSSGPNSGNDQIWIRQGHEVRAASSIDIPQLFFNNLFKDDDSPEILSQIPANVSTMKKFIGRLDVVAEIFRWLYEYDEPRAFLWGKGGSGKSTIAYEVARSFKRYGRGFVFDDSSIVEQVIYISAKQKYLNVADHREEKFQGNDFTDERSLFEAILTLGTSYQEDLSAMSLVSLKKSVEEFFNNNSCFLVIDDIDTILTANRDSGMEFLGRVVSRSKKSSKILYTLRNRPSFALSNSIEVPGLPEDEYRDFVLACAKQFNVPAPSDSFMEGRLKVLSERRPLVIESVMTLRRNCGNYENALQVFDQVHGEDVRNYVFQREWESLDSGDRGREVLALLALYKKPISFDDLVNMSKIDQQKVADAIAAIQDMFLVVEGAGEDSVFSLGELTRTFVSNSAKSLNFYENLKARVEKFKSTIYSDSPQINLLLSRLDRAIYDDRQGYRAGLVSLFKELDSFEYPPAVAEDPRFLSLFGYVCLLQKPPMLDKARQAFMQAYAFKFACPENYVRKWFDEERFTDQSNDKTKKIVEIVRSSKEHKADFKWEMVSRRSAFLYSHARAIIFDMPQRAVEALREAIDGHLSLYFYYADKSILEGGRAFERARNTSFYLIQQLLRGGDIDEFVDFINEGIKLQKRWYLDPLVEPFFGALRGSFSLAHSSIASMQRVQGRLEHCHKVWGKSDHWFDKVNRDAFNGNHESFKKAIEDRITDLRRKR